MKKDKLHTLDKLDAHIKDDINKKLEDLQEKANCINGLYTSFTNMVKDMGVVRAFHEMTTLIFGTEVYGLDMSLWDLYVSKGSFEGEDGDGGSVAFIYKEYEESLGDGSTRHDNLIEYAEYLSICNDEFKVGGLINDECVYKIRHEYLSNEGFVKDSIKKYIANDQPFCSSFLFSVYSMMSDTEKKEYTRICNQERNIHEIHT